MNRSINTGIPKEWKLANITMIPKNEFKSKNPNDYRPISLTSCLGKFAERLIKSRLYKTLEEKNILVNQQSGFREKRGTADNLLFFSQKISETFERGKNACSIFFDISKAFDKVWHSGLIFKLNEIGVDKYLIRYIKDFLDNRSFRVKVNNSFSGWKPIKCSVPQGSVLAPILFLVYINDIPLTNDKHLSYSSLFADDLCSFFIYKGI